MATEAKIEFIQYGTRSRGDKSGAYLFLPGILNYLSSSIKLSISNIRIQTYNRQKWGMSLLAKDQDPLNSMNSIYPPSSL